MVQQVPKAVQPNVSFPNVPMAVYLTSQWVKGVVSVEQLHPLPPNRCPDQLCQLLYAFGRSQLIACREEMASVKTNAHSLGRQPLLWACAPPTRA